MSGINIAAMLLPIGHFLGAFHPGPGAPAAYHAVRVGREIVRLPDADHRDVWALAHSDSGTRATLLTAASSAGIDDAEPIVDRLLASGVLAEVPPDPAARIGFASAHRLEPLLVGVGGGPGEPSDGMGVPGLLVAARVPPRVFELWQWAHLWPDLWAACRGLAEVSAGLGQDEPGESDPDRVLAFALEAIGAMIASSVAYLDARRTARPGASVGWSA